jgi:hypothetical protein
VVGGPNMCVLCFEKQTTVPLHRCKRRKRVRRRLSTAEALASYWTSHRLKRTRAVEKKSTTRMRILSVHVTGFPPPPEKTLRESGK